eukprot:13377809-Alexandrium_andersonii.AAC.1
MGAAVASLGQKGSPTRASMPRGVAQSAQVRAELDDQGPNERTQGNLMAGGAHGRPPRCLRRCSVR